MFLKLYNVFRILFRPVRKKAIFLFFSENHPGWEQGVENSVRKVFRILFRVFRFLALVRVGSRWLL
jgi:hypothetical protein